MLRFIATRCLGLIAILFSVVTITFFLVRLMPGGPFDRERKLPEHIEKQLLAKYKLDGPLPEQYINYLGDLVHGDLRLSTKYRSRSVNEILADSLPVSGLLGGIAFCVATIGGVLLGSLAAGPIADRYGKRGLSIISTVVLSTMLLLIPVTGWGPVLLGTFLVASLAYAFRQGPLQALATEMVPREARGALVAARTTTSQVGIAISTAGCGVLYDRYGYTAVGALSAALTLGAGLCIYLMREPRQEIPAERLQSET